MIIISADNKIYLFFHLAKIIIYLMQVVFWKLFRKICDMENAYGVAYLCSFTVQLFRQWKILWIRLKSFFVLRDVYRFFIIYILYTIYLFICIVIGSLKTTIFFIFLITKHYNRDFIIFLLLIVKRRKYCWFMKILPKCFQTNIILWIYIF